MFLLKLAIFGTLIIAIGTVVLTIVIALFIASLLFSLLFSPRATAARVGGGFIGSVASQVVGFFLIRQLFRQKTDMQVTNVRVRDRAGVEHLVRIEGYVVGGTVNVGDDVTIEGKDRRGTLIMRRGYNNRMRAQIQVKRH